MGAVGKLILIIGIGYLANCAYQLFCSVPPIPDIPEINYWGPGEKKKDDDLTIKPFKINVPDSVLKDLKDRLALDLRLQPSLEDSNFEYGFGSNELQRVLKYWKNDYDWRVREKLLNALPQFTTQISGLNIHFIHAQPKNVPKNVQVLPLLLLHGWPGSVKEFYDLIPMLTTPSKDRDFVFEVIAPSLPGYAFSEASQKRGLSPAHIAAIFKQLMIRLGHQKFYVQGGDWGAIILNSFSILYPENVLGMHSNLCFVNTPTTPLYMMLASLKPSLFMEKSLENFLYPLSDYYSNIILESGYMHIQATKPDTIGVGLNNSPAGLAAYILEKFSTWTHKKYRNLPDGGLEKKFKLADLLDNVMLYWVTGSITSSMRIYSECFNSQFTNVEKWDRLPILVPTFCVRFPEELTGFPDFVLRTRYKNLMSPSNLSTSDPLYEALYPPRGGHFAAFEEPQLQANSIFKGIDLIRKFI